MRKLMFALTALSTLAMLDVAPAQAFNRGCYRLGETGYHWYSFCVGPNFLYQHHRVCSHGRCWYR